MKYGHKLIMRIILALIITYQIFDMVITPLTKYLVYAINKLLFSITMTGDILCLNGFQLKFITACAAVSAYYLIFLLVVFTKDLSFKKSLKIFLTGALLILMMNILRIELMFFILINYGYPVFDKVHLFFWDIVSTAYVALVWILLIRYFSIKSIPIYSDVRHLMKRFKKK